MAPRTPQRLRSSIQRQRLESDWLHAVEAPEQPRPDYTGLEVGGVKLLDDILNLRRMAILERKFAKLRPYMLEAYNLGYQHCQSDAKYSRQQQIDRLEKVFAQVDD